MSNHSFSGEEIRLSGDIRSGYFTNHRDQHDGQEDSQDEFRARLRLGGRLKLSSQWEIGARIAGQYSTSQTNTRAKVDFSSKSAGLNRGDATLDQLYLGYSTETAGFTAGRLQTSFKLNGIAPKSLDRNDSNNMNITYTDGIHAWFKMPNQWKAHGIIQYNDKTGSGSLRRSPLKFTDNSSRASAFFSLENTSPWGPVTQRAVNISYLPQSLELAGSHEDYWAMTVRGSSTWPLEQSRKLQLGLQFGYAPETHIENNKQTNGFAWQASLNLYNLEPGHNIALIAGKAGSGWLLSPSFKNDQELLELRYQWKIHKKAKLEARIRLSNESNRPVDSQQKQQNTDFYLRYTHKI